MLYKWPPRCSCLPNQALCRRCFPLSADWLFTWSKYPTVWPWLSGQVTGVWNLIQINVMFFPLLWKLNPLNLPTNWQDIIVSPLNHPVTLGLLWTPRFPGSLTLILQLLLQQPGLQNFLSRNMYGCPYHVKEKAYFIYVRPQLECAYQVWFPQTITGKKKLENIQSTAGRFVTGRPLLNVDVISLTFPLVTRSYITNWPSLLRTFLSPIPVVLNKFSVL